MLRPARIVFWDVEEKKEKRAIEIPEEYVHLDVSPNGKNLLASGRSSYLFDAETGKKSWQDESSDLGYEFSGDGKTLLGLQSSHVRDKFLKIHFWDLATRKPLGKVQFPVEKTSIPFVTFSKNGLSAVVWEKIIHVLDLETGKELGQFS